MSWSYLRQGETGPVLVCLHGVGGNATAFQPQLEALSQQLQIWSLDLPGYGQSSPMEVMDWAGLALGLKQFFDLHQLRQVHLLGHSFGGMLAQEFAARYPEYLASLILYATSPAFGSSDGDFQQAFIAARLQPLDQGASMDKLATSMIENLLAKGAVPEVRQAAIDCMSQVPASTYRQAITCITSFDCRHNLALLTMPCLLLAGDEDKNANAGMMKKFASKIHGSQFYVFTGAGHLANLEQAADFNQKVGAFIARQGLS